MAIPWFMPAYHHKWSIEQALSYSAEVEKQLCGPQYKDYFTNMYGNQPEQWHEGLAGMDRLRIITNYFTRMRFCSPEGKLDLINKKGPDTASDGYQPWFSIPHRQAKQNKIIFGPLGFFARPVL